MLGPNQNKTHRLARRFGRTGVIREPLWLGGSGAARRPPRPGNQTLHMGITLLASVTIVVMGAAQERSPTQLDSLVAVALDQNPSVGAAVERVRAAEARIPAAGARPDPVLSLSLRNLPVTEPGFDDFMTMKTIGLSQRLPYPGKLSLAQDAERSEARAAAAALEEVRLDVARQVRQAYYDLVFIDRGLEVVGRHADVLGTLVSTADVRYAVGAAGQEDVLQAQVETAALADEAAGLTERRHVVLAALNRLLNRPPLTPLEGVTIPDEVTVAAVRAPDRLSFVSMDPGARVANSPLRPLGELLEAVAQNSPTIHVHVARIEAQQARLEWARKAHLPDFDVSLSYGQRDARTDMLTLSLAIPLPLSRDVRQRAWASEAEAELAALRSEHADHVNRLQARVTQLYADLERDRTSLGILTSGMLPQESAALQAATAGFGVARTDFSTVLMTQTALFQFETSFHRLLTDFAKNLAELEQLVAEEILR